MCLALAVLLVNPIFTVSAADNNYNEQVIDDLGQKKNLFPPLSWNNLYIKFYFRCSIY